MYNTYIYTYTTPNPQGAHRPGQRGASVQRSSGGLGGGSGLARAARAVRPLACFISDYY